MCKDDSVSSASILDSLEKCKGSSEEKFSLLQKALARLQLDQITKCELAYRFARKHFGKNPEVFGDLLMADQHLFTTITLRSVIRGYVYFLLNEEWFIRRVVVDIEEARKLFKLVLWMRQILGPDEKEIFNHLLRDLGFSFNGLDASDMMTILQEIDQHDPVFAAVLAEGWLKSQGLLSVAMEYLQTRCESQNFEQTKRVLAELLKTYPPVDSEQARIAQLFKSLIEHWGLNDAIHFLIEESNPHYRLTALAKPGRKEMTLKEVQEALKPFGELPPDSLDISRMDKRSALYAQLVNKMGEAGAIKWCSEHLGYWAQPPNPADSIP
jgi:hypothetical protein